jgi:hypothetical protein
MINVPLSEEQIADLKNRAECNFRSMAKEAAALIVDGLKNDNVSTGANND